MELRRTSTLLGCGCAVIVALFLGAIVAITWTTYRAGKEMERVARDPVAAAAAAREVVGFGELPEGYRALGVISVPFLFDVALFGAPVGGVDAVAAEGEPVPPFDRGFLYMRMREWMAKSEELEAQLRAGDADAAGIRQEGLKFVPGEVVARGETRFGEADVLWLARRGDVTIDPETFGGGKLDVSVDGEPLAEPEDDAGEGGTEEGGAGEERQSVPGVLTVLLFDCPGEGDDWHRLGVWFAPDPAPETPAAEVDWSGTPGDPAAIADLLGRFELCG
ncbi:MAG TPA: hypothetical protein VHM02_00815 [Thermoanaerobaculia bacterium]|nr:hypothetical protein [Thermoanaerobaculia bacterium]